MAVRFWTFVHGSPVRLRLEEQQTLRWHSFQYTDEGWERRSEDWQLFDGNVCHDWLVEAQDCDGRLDRSGYRTCPVEDLAAGRVDDVSGLPLPEWAHEDSEVRDYQAEAAGY